MYIFLLSGKKPEHLNMLEGGIIAKLLEEKWTTFANMIFLKRLSIHLIHLLCIGIGKLNMYKKDFSISREKLFFFYKVIY